MTEASLEAVRAELAARGVSDPRTLYPVIRCAVGRRAFWLAQDGVVETRVLRSAVYQAPWVPAAVGIVVEASGKIAAATLVDGLLAVVAQARERFIAGAGCAPTTDLMDVASLVFRRARCLPGEVAVEDGDQRAWDRLEALVWITMAVDVDA